MSETRRKTHIYMVRCEPSEAEEIASLALDSCLSVPELFRRSVLNRMVDSQAKLKAEAIRELSRVGSNLNQIARHANAGEIILHDDLSDTLAAIRDTAACLTERGGRK